MPVALLPERLNNNNILLYIVCVNGAESHVASIIDLQCPKLRVFLEGLSWPYLSCDAHDLFPDMIPCCRRRIGSSRNILRSLAAESLC